MRLATGEHLITGSNVDHNHEVGGNDEAWRLRYGQQDISIDCVAKSCIARACHAEVCHVDHSIGNIDSLHH